MNRVEKESIVTQMREKFSKANITILTDYCGINVESINNLRRTLRSEKIEYKVMKNTLAKIASKGTPSEGLVDEFKGTIGVAFGFGDPTLPPRLLFNFIKDHEKFSLKAASFNGKKVGVDTLKTLASLPSRQELLTKVAFMFAAPMKNMATCLAAVPRNFANCLVALKEQKENK
jgi:large subunit ribosomal protein L10